MYVVPPYRSPSQTEDEFQKFKQLISDVITYFDFINSDIIKFLFFLLATEDFNIRATTNGVLP